MWGWFGGSAAKKDAPKDAILGLRSQLEMLSKREKHLENQMEEQDRIARKHVSTNKNAAKAALRRKKQFETALENTSSQILTLEQQIYSIEAANINKTTLDAMKNASTAMRKIHGKLTVDEVDNIMEGLKEEHAIATEISDVISQGVRSDAIDEGSLEEELEALQQEELDNRMLDTGSLPANKLPSAPENAIRSGKTKQAQEEEEDEEEVLRKLQAEMAM